MWYQLLKNRLLKADEMEIGQAKVRLVLASASFFWLLYIAPYNIAFTIIFLYIVFSLGIFAHMVYAPELRHHRLRLTCITDPCLVVSIFFLAGVYAAPLMFIFFTSPVGNGLRFGLPYLIPSMICNAIALLISLLLIEDYHQDWILIASIFLTFVVTNMAVGSIVRKLALIKVDLARLALHDSLTGLPNRTLFKEHLDKFISASRRSKKHVACFFIDLDGFKAVNDRYGHGIGDQLIIKIGMILRECMRGTDIAARLSGDEFVVAVPCNEDHKAVLGLEDRILKQIEAINRIESHQIAISASIGVAYFNPNVQPRMDSDALIQQADAAMYEAKYMKKKKMKVTANFLQSRKVPCGSV